MRIAILNNNTNFYPPHNVHQLTMQSPTRKELKNKAELIKRIATPNNKTNSYPPHKRTVTATENLSKAELKKAESKKRIAIPNNKSNSYPPHNER